VTEQDNVFEATFPVRQRKLLKGYERIIPVRFGVGSQLNNFKPLHGRLFLSILRTASCDKSVTVHSFNSQRPKRFFKCQHVDENKTPEPLNL